MTSNDTRAADTVPALSGVAARGASVTMLGQAVRFAIQLVGTVLLARLLDPTDFGLVAMVVAVVGVAEVFRDFGLSSAAVQARTLSRAQRDNLFWINTLIGGGLTVAVACSAGLVAEAYSEPALTALVHALSINFLLNGIATQYRADLNRQMRFRALSVLDMVVPAVGLAAAVAAAVAGWGPWALVCQHVVTSLVGLVLVVAASGWLPGRPRRGQHMGGFLTFGWNLLGVQVLSYVSQNVDTMIIGSRFGAAAAGVYSRAFQLFMMPLNQINAPATRIALPVLSRIRDDRARFDAYVLHAQAILVHVVTACFALGCVLAPQIIGLVLGPEWQDAAPVFRILCVAGVFQACSYATYWIFLSRGMTGANLRYTLATKPVLVLALLAGSQFGVLGIATGYAVAIAALWPVGLWWVSRVAGAPGRQMLGNGLRAVIGHVIAGGVAAGAVVAVATDTAAVEVLTAVAGYALTLVLLSTCWPELRRDVRRIATVVALVRTRPGRAASTATPSTATPSTRPHDAEGRSRD